MTGGKYINIHITNCKVVLTEDLYYIIEKYSIKLFPIKLLKIFKIDYVPTEPDLREMELKNILCYDWQILARYYKI